MYIYLCIRISNQIKTKNNAPLHSFLLINRHRITVARPRQMITMIVHRRHRRIWAHRRPVIINGTAPAVVAAVLARIGHAMIRAVSDISASRQWARRSVRCCAALPAPIIYHVRGAQCPYAAGWCATTCVALATCGLCGRESTNPMICAPCAANCFMLSRKIAHVCSRSNSWKGN